MTGPEAVQSPPLVPEELPGDCPAPAARTVADRLARSDGGDVSADLDLAACWRLFGHTYPESVALARALERGLPEPAASAVRARLSALGGWPVATGGRATGEAEDAGPGAGLADLPDSDAAHDYSTPAASVLAGVAAAGLIAGTALGLATLHEMSRSEREPGKETLELEYGVASGVCLGVGIVAGIAAVLLWPDGGVGPAMGPGDVGIALEVRW